MLQALLESSFSPLSLRGAAADCLAEMLTKRMEPTAKLALIKVRVYWVNVFQCFAVLQPSLEKDTQNMRYWG